jgi:hypothetical protein
MRDDKDQAQTHLRMSTFHSLAPTNEYCTVAGGDFVADDALRNVGLSPLYGMGITVTRESSMLTP